MPKRIHECRPVPPIVSLRRAGDILGILPIVHWISQRSNGPVPLVVHRNYQSLVEGASYVSPIFWDGDTEDPIAATARYKGVNAQVWGRNLRADQRHGNFAERAWTQLGYEWNRHFPLVIDRRNYAREEALAKAVFKTDLPKILVKFEGFSSPFDCGPMLDRLLHYEFGDLAEIVSLDDIRAERLYDLIGLLDRAACLLSIDTCPLWLAKASKCPVIALVNSKPFFASPPSGNVILRVHYCDVLTRWEEIVRAIHTTLMSSFNENIVLVYNEFKTENQEICNRQARARLTWNNLPCRRLPFQPKRSSCLCGDKYVSPFIRDMVEGAISTGDESIVAISNTDIQFRPELHRAVVDSCRDFGCYWSYRLVSPTGTKTDNGADFFAFTREWWFMHEHMYPDLLTGFYWWDDVFVRMMLWSGCTERPRHHFHEPHPNGGFSREKTRCACYNRTAALVWLAQNHELNHKPFD